MKTKLTGFALAAIAFAACVQGPTQKSIQLSGKVQFPDDRFKMFISQFRDGERVYTDSFELAEDGSYHYEMPVTEAGVYSLDCQKWQSVNFWAEDENLEINFRGQDTAKIKIKNPPYVYLNGGPKNELMNQLNFDAYRNYQQMIGISQTIYKATRDIPEKYGELSGQFYDLLSDESKARMRYLAEHNADKTSVLAVVARLKANEDSALIASTLATLEAAHPNYAPLQKYVADKEEARLAKLKMEIGQPAPEFSLPDPDGKLLGPADFKGKLVLIDFWASWCGPCRQEIPHMKEVYEAYQAKGVEILSVSIDKSESEWRKAMGEEEMPWPQVHAPHSGRDLLKAYQFSGIPFIVLLDGEGKIVAKNLRGEAIDQKLDELLSAE